MLRGKKILLGVSASIAAYKAAILIRLLKKNGAEVKVVLTPASLDFVTPLTLSTLSNNPVYSTFVNEDDANAEWNNHVELGLWADVMIIAPATSNTLSNMVTGACNNLLLATYMSAKCPVYFAPAMDLDMYKNEATLNNIAALTNRGHILIEAEHGELASGLIGQGRMAEPENIVEFLINDLKKGLPLTGKKVLINAGPTYERIDAVRFIGNFSTGKMGVALAQQALKYGADVTLVLGPTQVPHVLDGLNVIRIESADDLYKACIAEFEKSDIAILTAAVADFKPKKISTKKIKKTGADLNIELEPTLDTLAELGKMKTNKQILVGFALETNDELNYAKDKLKRKNLDYVVLNSLRDPGAGFGHDTNKVVVISKDGNMVETPLLQKQEVAVAIWNNIIKEHV